MRLAAIIFLVSGLAYLGWDVSLSITYGANISSLLMAGFATALVFTAYTLHHERKGARWGAVVTSCMIVIASGYILSVFIEAPSPEILMETVSDSWPFIGTVALVFVAYIIAIISLLLAKPVQANVEKRTD